MVNASRYKATLRILLGLLFVITGTLHFTHPSFFLEIMPTFLPYPLALVYISGVCEILGGIGVWVPSCRRLAGYGLIALLIAVFPANIKMFTDQLHRAEFSLVTVILFLRLPLQVGFIALVHWLTKKE